jgi:hypothetical protein
LKFPPYESSSIAVGVAGWAIFAALFAIVAGLLLIPVGESVPSYAMDSVLLFRLERALAIATLLILPALVIGPLLSGTLPQKLSSDGIDWGEDRANVVKSLDEVNKRVDAQQKALDRIAEKIKDE